MSKKKKAEKKSGFSEEEIRTVLDPYIEESIYEIFYEPEDCGAILHKMEDCGFENEYVAYKAYQVKDVIPTTIFLSEIGGKYFVYMSGSLIQDTEYTSDLLEMFFTLEEAEECYQTLKNQNFMSVEDQIALLVKNFNYEPEDLFFSTKSIYGFRVYYKRLLILEHTFLLKADEINLGVQKLLDFINRYDISIDELYKPGRKWNDNQRYYHIVGTTSEGKDFSERIHIPSKLRHRSRYPIDVIENDRSGALQKITGIPS